MKKYVRLLLLALLVIPLSVKAYPIDGLTEHMNDLWLSEDVLIHKISNSYSTKIDKLISQYLAAPSYARQKAGLPVDDNELIDYVNSTMTLDYTTILKVIPFTTQKYMLQYAENNLLDYLFYDKIYFSVLKEDGEYSESFNSNGECISSETDNYELCRKLVSSVIGIEGVTFLKDLEAINLMLAEKGETFIKDIKLVVLDFEHTLLYINGHKNDYLIQVYAGRFNTADGDIEKFKLYTANEYSSKITLTNLVQNEKQIYLEEAESLQAEGLLQGTEKGLELLKPLTRAEAATILLRAIGESTENENAEIQTFSDVTPDYWGYGAVENSYKLRIMNGIGNKLFAPEENVTSAQFSTMVLRASGTYDFNWETALNLLIEKGVISQEDSKTMDFFTRGDMAKIIYEAKAKGLF